MILSSLLTMTPLVATVFISTIISALLLQRTFSTVSDTLPKAVALGGLSSIISVLLYQALMMAMSGRL